MKNKELINEIKELREVIDGLRREVQELRNSPHYIPYYIPYVPDYPKPYNPYYPTPWYTTPVICETTDNTGGEITQYWSVEIT